jgi:hypothetical protein
MGINAALYSGSKCYFFVGNQYIRVTRGDTGPGTVDPDYPRNISAWEWPSRFGRRELILVHFKSLLYRWWRAEHAPHAVAERFARPISPEDG